MKTETATLYIIGGANGVGKTSAFFNDFPIDCPFINADEIAQQIRQKTSAPFNIQELANREALALMNGYLANRQSFCFESNLSDNDTWKFIEAVQLSGYQICIYFYCLDDINICIQRVKQRVLEGGHDVRPDIIKQRYESGLLLLKHYFALVDTLLLIDNAFVSTICAVVSKGTVVQVLANAPAWVNQLLTLPISENTPEIPDTIESIRERYHKK
jgi:predicted ABC-type ATPase